MEMEVGDIPTVLVQNKIDLLDDTVIKKYDRLFSVELLRYLRRLLVSTAVNTLAVAVRKQRVSLRSSS